MYNKYQLEAINSTEEKVIIVAPPGSGKTHTMTGAIQKFLKENPINIGITAITFTNKAADELRERLGFNAGSIHIATIHSWSYTELQKLSKKHSFRLRVLDEQGIKEILTRFMGVFGVQDRWLGGVYSFVMGNFNPDLPIYVKVKYNQIKDAYIEYKREMFLYDFTDYPLYLSDQLDKYRETITLEGIFVDEFQDVDPVQLTVFNRVDAKRKFFIGDPDQAIYQFRGATEDIFKDLQGYKLYTLHENYRSYQEIIDFAFDVKNNSGFGESESEFVIASRGKGGIVYETDKTFLSPFARVIRHKNGVSQEVDFTREVLPIFTKYNWTVLCRTNREVKRAKELGFNTAITIHQSKGLEFDNVIVISFEDKSLEDINVRFVAHTRARNLLVTMNMEGLEYIASKNASPIQKLF